MSRKSRLDEPVFIVKRILFAFAAVFFYMMTMFRGIGDLSYRNSVLVLAGIVMATLIFGTLLQMYKTSEDRLVTWDQLAAFGLYAIISYWGVAWKLIAIIMILTLDVVLYHTLPDIVIKIRRGKKPVRVISRVFRGKYEEIRDIIIGGIIIVLICMIGFRVVNDRGHFVISLPAKTVKTDKSGQTIEDNMEKLILLDNSNWHNLTEGEKLSVMQKVADIECDNLGIPHNLKVCLGNTSDGILGSYNDTLHQITLNRDHLNNDNSYEIVDTIAHETHHAYAHRAVELLSQVDDEYKDMIVFDNIKEYKEEINNYISAEQDEFKYYTQTMEIEAREYGHDRMDEYYYAVYQYIHDKEPIFTDSEYTINENIYEHDPEDEDDPDHGEYITDVSEGELGYYSYITTSYGNKGVVDKEGNIIVLPVYKDVFADLEYMDIRDGTCTVSFILSYYNGEVNTYTYCWPVDNDSAVTGL